MQSHTPRMDVRSKGAETKRVSNFRRLDDIISLSRMVPTIQLFDAIWQATFAWLQQCCPQAVAYLQETYFQAVAVENLQRQLRCNKSLWEAQTLWFAGFWGGIIGTYPGSSSGTQSLESFHSYWQARIRAKARAKPTDILQYMQELYKDDWAQKFQWEQKRTFMTWPEKSAAVLYNSEALRSAGRSPAADFWNEREKKLCGNRNYFQIWVRTDGQKASADPAGVTTFWVLRARKYKDVQPAAAVITKDVATIVANLIAAEGEELARWLEKSGLVTSDQGTRVLDSDRLRNLFFFHCVVMEGHLPNSCWARRRAKLRDIWPTRLCTCQEFLMHADCEHIIYVKALTDEKEAAALAKVPLMRQRGRKRKTAPVGPESQEVKKPRRQPKASWLQARQ